MPPSCQEQILQNLGGRFRVSETGHTFANEHSPSQLFEPSKGENPSVRVHARRACCIRFCAFRPIELGFHSLTGQFMRPARCVAVICARRKREREDRLSDNPSAPRTAGDVVTGRTESPPEFPLAKKDSRKKGERRRTTHPLTSQPPNLNSASAGLFFLLEPPGPFALPAQH